MMLQSFGKHHAPASMTARKISVIAVRTAATTTAWWASRKCGRAACCPGQSAVCTLSETASVLQAVSRRTAVSSAMEEPLLQTCDSLTCAGSDCSRAAQLVELQEQPPVPAATGGCNPAVEQSPPQLWEDPRGIINGNPPQLGPLLALNQIRYP